jgi:ATP-binding cassette subfamily B protein
VVPLLERHIVDGVILSHTASLWPWLISRLVLAPAAFGFAYQRRYRGGRVALADSTTCATTCTRTCKMDFANLDRMPTGQLVARATSDSALVQGLLNPLPNMAGNVLLLSLGVMVFLSPSLAVVGLVIAPALLFVSYPMRRRIFPATWAAQQREGDLVQIVDEDISDVRVVKAFGQERRELERIADPADNLCSSQLRAVRL